MIGRIVNSKNAQALVAQVGTKGFAVISFMILARILSKEDFGQWVLYLSIMTFIDMIKDGIVQTALVKYSSGTEGDLKNELIGSSWTLNLSVVFLIALISYSLYFSNLFEFPGVIYFLKYYPVYAIASMPFYYFICNHQVILEFKKITIIRMFNSSGFLIVCLFAIFQKFRLEFLVLLHIGIYSLASILAIVWGGSGYHTLFKSTKKSMLKILAYGKFHMMAFLGSNLLKSSDVFLIGAFMGPTAIAIYSVPLRLVQLVETPLKSAITVAFPVFSAHDNNEDTRILAAILEKYVGVLTLLYVPFMGLLYLFSENLVVLIGGEGYLNAVIIFEVFLIYGLFLPFDRLTGITLDAMGFPKLNFYKVLIMASVNIIGDLLVIHYFQSLELIALVTVVNVISGMVVGYLLVRKRIDFKLKNIFAAGAKAIWNELKNSIENIHLKKENNEN